jgi:hypothetical protein
MQQIEQALRKIIGSHNFNSNEGFSCLISDKEPYPSNEGFLLWFSFKTRIETKIQLFHTPQRIRRMEDMLNLAEKQYAKLFFMYLEELLNSLREIGFEDIGKGVDLFGKGKLYNVKASFELFENNPEALKVFELITINNSIVKFAEEQGYFTCTNREHLVWDDFASGIGFSATAPETVPITSAKETKVTGKRGGGTKEILAPETTPVTPVKETKVTGKSGGGPTETLAFETTLIIPAKETKVTGKSSGGLKDTFQLVIQVNGQDVVNLQIPENLQTKSIDIRIIAQSELKGSSVTAV